MEPTLEAPPPIVPAEPEHWDGLLEIMHPIGSKDAGDSKQYWNRNNPVEVEMARETFDKYVKKGYAAFAMSRAGDKEQQVNKFDPDMERVLFVAPIRGG